MSNLVKPQPAVASAAALVQRLHNHTNIDSHESASRFKTGVLDVDLMKVGLKNVPECLDDCAVVTVSYAARTVNRITRKSEAVFNTYDANGTFIGTYFSSVFKSFAC